MRTAGAEETRALGARLASQLRPGDVILLTGDLGAGKSELARGIARGLGIAGAVPSPTFTWMNIYEDGRLPLYHFDWYRATDGDEIADAGFEEFLRGEGASLIEWHERAPWLLPDKALEIVIEKTGDTAREIRFIYRGGFRPLEGF